MPIFFFSYKALFSFGLLRCQKKMAKDFLLTFCYHLLNFFCRQYLQVKKLALFAGYGRYDVSSVKFTNILVKALANEKLDTKSER